MDTTQISQLAGGQPLARQDSQFQAATGQSASAQRTVSAEELRALEQTAASKKQKPRPDQERERPQLDSEQLEAVTARMEEFMGSLNRNLSFSVHEDSGRNVVKVIDQGTKEVVRQIPSEEMLDIAAKLGEASGLFVNAEA